MSECLGVFAFVWVCVCVCLCVCFRLATRIGISSPPSFLKMISVSWASCRLMYVASAPPPRAQNPYGQVGKGLGYGSLLKRVGVRRVGSNAPLCAAKEYFPCHAWLLLLARLWQDSCYGEMTWNENCSVWSQAVALASSAVPEPASIVYTTELHLAHPLAYCPESDAKNFRTTHVWMNLRARARTHTQAAHPGLANGSATTRRANAAGQSEENGR